MILMREQIEDATEAFWRAWPFTAPAASALHSVLRRHFQSGGSMEAFTRALDKTVRRGPDLRSPMAFFVKTLAYSR